MAWGLSLFASHCGLFGWMDWDPDGLPSESGTCEVGYAVSLEITELGFTAAAVCRGRSIGRKLLYQHVQCAGIESLNTSAPQSARGTITPVAIASQRSSAFRSFRPTAKARVFEVRFAGGC